VCVYNYWPTVSVQDYYATVPQVLDRVLSRHYSVIFKAFTGLKKVSSETGIGFGTLV